jgi:SAM-dependent methyltransferase
VDVRWLLWLRPRSVAVAQRAGNVVFDRLMGIDTAGIVETSELGFGQDVGRPYHPSNWVNLVAFVRMMRAVDIGRDSAFIDLGCGKGQVAFVAARFFPFARVIGLDLSQDLIAVARSNLDPARHRFRSRKVDLVVGDAAGYAVPVDVDTVYMYNPFPRSILERVIERVDASLAARPRRLRLFYLEAADADLLIAAGFRETRRIRRLHLFERDAVTPIDP